VLLALLAVLVLTLVYQVWTWPRPERLRTGWPPTTAFIERYRSTQRAVRRDDRVSWTVVPYTAIATDLKRAVVVEEDINFFSHRGFDFGEIGRALDRAVEEGETPRGASTITQQLAKNLWLSPSRNPLRKVKEAILTWQLERTLSKRRILELYLNVVEFGPGLYGVEAAARHYFGKPAAALDAREAAQLAAALPRPRRWHPGSPSRAYQAHVERVLRRMTATAWLGRLI
jgi:monofunctional biosynthetic peptidoglycan transglycosylase